jgi:hypothetical protein
MAVHCDDLVSSTLAACIRQVFADSLDPFTEACHCKRCWDHWRPIQILSYVYIYSPYCWYIDVCVEVGALRLGA